MTPRPGARGRLRGVVRSGVGDGARFTALPWVRAQLREKLGFDPHPGTLNLVVPADRLRALLARLDPVWVDPEPGFCRARCYPATVAGRVEAAVVVPEVEGYPEDLAEVVAPVPLRGALGLRDGDPVTLRLGPGRRLSKAWAR